MTTSIDIGLTTTKSSAVFEIHYESFSPWQTGTFAETRLFLNSSEDSRLPFPPSQNYKWASIMLNGKAFDDASSPHIKLDTQKAVISHEFGHAFGLAHNMGSSANSSIMRANDWYVHKPGLIDLQTINYLYG